MKWEIIVSAKLKKTDNKNNNWEMVYTSLNNKQIVQNGNSWLKPAFDYNTPIHAACYQNSVYFIVWTRPNWENLTFYLNSYEEYRKFYLVQYDFSLSKEIRRLEIPNLSHEPFDKERNALCSVELVLSGLTPQSPALVIFRGSVGWILDLSLPIEKQIAVPLDPLIKNLLKSKLQNYNFLPEMIRLWYYVWQGYLIVHFEINFETDKVTWELPVTWGLAPLYGLLVFHNKNYNNIIEGIWSFKIINHNLVFFFTNDNMVWAVTSCKELFQQSKTLNYNQWKYLQKDGHLQGDCNSFLKIWKEKYCDQKTQPEYCSKENFTNNPNNTASKLLQYTKEQRMVRMNQIIVQCGLFLPKDILFFVTEF
jgi:hypothetical protein